MTIREDLRPKPPRPVIDSPHPGAHRPFGNHMLVELQTVDTQWHDAWYNDRHGKTAQHLPIGGGG